MTKKEASIVSAYTGYLIGEFSEMHKYAEELYGRPILTHEFAGEVFAEQLRDRAKKDFIEIEVL